MSLGSPLDQKEQVKQAIDIVDLVGSYVQLRRQGRGYVAICPWHDDSRPSLQVNPERQSWKCWVCDIGGDVFSFVMQMEGVGFREALQMLADRANITLEPLRRSQPGAEPAAAEIDKRALYRAMAWAEQQYHQCLLELPEGQPGREYLAERGISAESIEKFHLGFSPEGWDWILKRAEAARANVKLLETVGIAVRSAGTGRSYDRFRGRVLFSIRDTQGRPVGIGGRVLPAQAANQPAKYVNSPETPLFSKSHLLYGLDIARDAIRRDKSNKTVLVMEGYTDCIMAHQYGFTNTVAVLGTALGEGHLRLLKRFADRVVLILDGDEAGQRRANEVLELFVAQRADLRVLTLPKEKDPCDFLLKHGAEAFRNLIDHEAIDALEHAFRVATRSLDVEHDVHGASAALTRLIGIVAKAPRQDVDTTPESRIREEKILQRLAGHFRMDEKELRQQVSELRRKASRPEAPVNLRREEAEPPAEARREAWEPLDPWQRSFLELIVLHPQCLAESRGEVTAEHFGRTAGRAIYEACCRLADTEGAAGFERLMLEFDDPQIKGLLVELDEQGRAKGLASSDPAALIKELITTQKRREAQRRRPAQTVALREGQLDENQQLELLQAILQQERARQGISRPTEG